MENKAWSVAAVGGMLAAGAVLAGCGGGSGGHRVAQGGSPAGPDAATTVPAAVTTVPATTVPAPAPTVPATTVPATSVPAPAPTVPPPATTTPAPVLIVRSFDGTVGYEGREPSTIGFSGDSSNIVTHLTWISWGPTTAVGRGTLGVNDCKPNCATGTVTQQPAIVDLGQVVSGHFTAMTEKSGSSDRSYTYPSNWAASAS